MRDLAIALNHFVISVLFQFIVQPDFAGVKREVDTYLDMTIIMSVSLCVILCCTKSVVFIKSVRVFRVVFPTLRRIGTRLRWTRVEWVRWG